VSSGGCWRKWRKKPSGHRSLRANCFDALHFSKIESKINASAAQAVPRTSHRIPIPISCRALSLSVDSQRCERSRTLLFSDSFDPRGFMNNSILCRLFPGDLGSGFERVGLSGANALSIGHATVFSDGFPEGKWLTSSRRRGEILFRFRNSQSRFRAFKTSS
jgi:hypothetical protein